MIGTVTLSQIVHLTLRRMFDLKANFKKAAPPDCLSADSSNPVCVVR